MVVAKKWPDSFPGAALAADVDLKARLCAEAHRLGFLRARVASADADLDMGGYDAFLAAGRHADMEWLATGRDARAAAGRCLPGARSVLVLAFDYTHALPADPGGLTGRVASYAWGRDYHNFVLKRVRKLQSWLRTHAPEVDSYSSVDMRPVYERAWAARAGLGYAAKNTFQVLPGESSRFVLATLLLTAELAADPPMGDHCGRCTRCLDVCPTGAFVGPGELDARRCISYLTIESTSAVPETLRPGLGRWVFGCDDCQDVCPHQRAATHDVPETRPRHAWLGLFELLAADDASLRARFEGSPIRRAADHRLRRNAAYVLGNLGDVCARPALEAAAREGGVVGDAAEWAIERLRAAGRDRPLR